MEGSVMEERYLSLAEACEVLGKSERTLYRWIKSGKLKAYKPGRDYEIPESAIQEMRERSEVYPKLQASLWPEEEPERRNPEPGEAERRWRNPDATEASRIAEEINLPPSLDSLNIVDIMRDVVDADRRRNEQQITRHRESGESQTTYSSVVREFEHRMEDQLGGAFGGFMYSGLRNSVLRILDLEEENARLKKEVETAQERAANV